MYHDFGQNYNQNTYSDETYQCFMCKYNSSYLLYKICTHICMKLGISENVYTNMKPSPQS